MPLYKEWSINSHSLAAIWKIEEPETFFVAATGLTSDIKNDKRRAEYLAGRYLLRFLKEDFPLHTIHKDEHDKPRIEGNKYYFSISHSWPYVAVVISTDKECGIDIQTWKPNIHKIVHKFLAPREQEFFMGNEQHLTTAWSAKEAAYKWNGRRAIDFIQHLPILFFEQIAENTNINIFINSNQFSGEIPVKGFIDADFVCVYVQNEI
jgi:phosphopantetheinyl transferase